MKNLQQKVDIDGETLILFIVVSYVLGMITLPVLWVVLWVVFSI